MAMPFGPAAEPGDALDAAVGRHARERAALDLDDEHRAVVQGHGSLREAEARGDFTKLHGDSFRTLSPCYLQRPFKSMRTFHG
jgi:hypothetical protein